MRKHEFHKCEEERCNVCDGGLQWCTVCGQAEAELADECPGTKDDDRDNEWVPADGYASGPEVLETLSRWWSGQGDALYELHSLWSFGGAMGYRAPRSTVSRALRNLRNDIKAPHLNPEEIERTRAAIEELESIEAGPGMGRAH